MVKSQAVVPHREEIVKKVRSKKGIVSAQEVLGKFDVPAIHGHTNKDPIVLGLCVFPDDKEKAFSLRIWLGQKIGFYAPLSADQIDELVRGLISAKALLMDHEEAEDPEPY